MQRHVIFALLLVPVLVVGVLAMRIGPDGVAARQASPTPAYAQGITAEILGRRAATAAPDYYLQLARITFAPGASVAAHTHPGDTVTHEESGTHVFTVLAGEAFLVRAGSATPAAGSAPGERMELGVDYTIEPGDVLLFDAGTLHTARNPSSEPAVLLESQLRAVDQPLSVFQEMGTPVP